MVVDVDSNNKTITVIRLQEPQRGQSEISMLDSSEKHEIVETKKRFKEIKINSDTELYKNCINKVVDRAKEALKTQTINGKEIKNLVTLNSKHFANYCKTGKYSNLQDITNMSR